MQVANMKLHRNPPVGAALTHERRTGSRGDTKMLKALSATTRTRLQTVLKVEHWTVLAVIIRTAEQAALLISILIWRDRSADDRVQHSGNFLSVSIPSLRANLQGRNIQVITNVIYVICTSVISVCTVSGSLNPFNVELNPICHLLALLAHLIIHVSRIRVHACGLLI